MPGVMAATPEVEASCAICGALSTYGECPHEGERLKLALDQAVSRWQGIQRIRDWVLNHARDQILNTFHQLKAARCEQHLAYLHTLPCYALYQRYRGNPPLPAPQIDLLHQQISQARAIYQAGVDDDWRRSCLRYPEVLDYYFSLVEVGFPSQKDTAVREPVFGASGKETRKFMARRDSVEIGRKRERRRSSRGRTP